jgi:CRISPR-associated protein Cas1
MHQLLNTLYVTTENSFLRLDHETLKVSVDKETKLQVPLHHLGGVVCFGDVMVSPALMRRCGEDGRSLVLLDRNGRFKARLEGPVSGNVLLRRAQHEWSSNAEKSLGIAKKIVAGKIQNSRQVLMRAAREAVDAEDEEALREGAAALADSLSRIPRCDDIDRLRGNEGESARAYFNCFDRMVLEDRESFRLDGRNRRPPQDPMNALLSFLYSMLTNDCVGAAEGVGLDPQVGFLHVLRPGRPALALDLMEELRAVLADRLALTLVNRRQITTAHFDDRPGGAVYLGEEGRKCVVVAYQTRKQEEILHPLLEQKVPLGLVPHIQARLLARVLRGDMEDYVPFLQR